MRGRGQGPRGIMTVSLALNKTSTLNEEQTEGGKKFQIPLFWLRSDSQIWLVLSESPRWTQPKDNAQNMASVVASWEVSLRWCWCEGAKVKAAHLAYICAFPQRDGPT